MVCPAVSSMAVIMDRWMTKGEFAEKGASFKTINPDNGNIGVLLHKSFARIGQSNDEIDERMKWRKNEFSFRIAMCIVFCN